MGPDASADPDADAIARNEQLRRERENDPRYWKRLYENLQNRVDQEREDDQRRRETYNSMLIVCAVVGVPLLALKWLGWL